VLTVRHDSALRNAGEIRPSLIQWCSGLSSLAFLRADFIIILYMENELFNADQLRHYKLKDAGRESMRELLSFHPVPTGNSEIDTILEGGIEMGNYYLFLGAAKAGKSTFLRCLGMSIAEKHPVLYLNFEQRARSTFSKIYELTYKHTLREMVHHNLELVENNISKLPDFPFYVAFWPDDLDTKSFNKVIQHRLEKNLELIAENDPEKRKPIVFIENLSDIYNERINGQDNMVNVVTQTAQDIKNFCIKHDIAIFMAHHSAKMERGQIEPSMDDVRDSKRVIDIAHSIFSVYSVHKTDALGRETYDRKMKYIAGRGAGNPKKWNVIVEGLKVRLEEDNKSIEISQPFQKQSYEK